MGAALWRLSYGGCVMVAELWGLLPLWAELWGLSYGGCVMGAELWGLSSWRLSYGG